MTTPLSKVFIKAQLSGGDYIANHWYFCLQMKRHKTWSIMAAQIRHGVSFSEKTSFEITWEGFSLNFNRVGDWWYDFCPFVDLIYWLKSDTKKP